LIATNEFDAFAGSELLWAESAARLATEGKSVFVNTPRWRRLPLRVSRLAQTENVSVEMRPTGAPIVVRLFARASLGNVQKYFDRYRIDYLRRTRPDLAVISQGGLVDGMSWMKACIATDVPFVAIVHLVADALWPQASDIEQASKSYGRAKKVFFVSEENKRLAARQLGVDFAAAELVRNPYGVRYDAAPKWPQETKVWRLACVARLGAEHKGQDLIVEALSAQKWRDRDLEVTLVGEGHHRAYLERLISARKCYSVRFAGRVDDILSVWAGHHALLMPSRYEGLPIALVEAMLCHRMAIVTNVGGNSELVEDGVNGFIAPAPTLASVSETLDRAWEKRDQWQEMGARAARRVRQTIPPNPLDVFLSTINSLLA
jgi:glycosyltransferase involved in cell wall biosynthesis